MRFRFRKTAVGIVSILALCLLFLRCTAEKPASAFEPEVPAGRALGKLVLKDTLGNETVPLDLTELNIHVRIRDGIAVTRVDQTFFNPTDRDAEGVFYFPLPEGASISRFAMYVDNQLVEGEVVERVYARQVYESIVRRMQDPALMEWQEGNVFKTRIFPIPAKGPKRIILSFTQQLPSVDGKRKYVYPLRSKMTSTASVGKFTFTADVPGTDDGSVRLSGYPEASVHKEAETMNVVLEKSGFIPQRDLVLYSPGIPSGRLKMAADRREGEDGFFMLSYIPEKTAEEPIRSRDVLFMVDTSLSREAGDFKAQLNVLRHLISGLSEKDRFALMTFDVVPRMHHMQFIRKTAQSAESAAENVKTILPLGATDMEKAFMTAGRFLEKTRPEGFREIILISDGIPTIGKTSQSELSECAAGILEKYNVRFTGIAMGSEFDGTVFRQLARSSGGLFRVLEEGDTFISETERLSAILKNRLMPGPEISFTGCDVYDVYPEKPGSMIPGREMIVTGRYRKAGEAKVSLKLNNDTAVESDFSLPESISSNVYIPRIWAREKLDRLLLMKPFDPIPAFDDEIEVEHPVITREPERLTVSERIIELSQEFTLITPHTSFLVLENEEAYAKYNIDRKKRRKYWEEMEGVRESIAAAAPAVSSSPREETAVPARQNPQRPVPEQMNPAGEKVKEEKKKFDLSGLDFNLLSRRITPGRSATTALSTLALQIYYRYLPVSMLGGSDTNVRPHSFTEKSFEEIMQLIPDNLIPHSDFAAVQVPVQVKNLHIEPERVSMPSPTDTTPADLEKHLSEWAEDKNVSRGCMDFLADIPLTGKLRQYVYNQAEYPPYGWRDGGGRRRAVGRGGGSACTESAVDAALRWFKRTQTEDGDWDGMEESCLAMLCYLNAGHTQKAGRYRTQVVNGLDWLKGNMNDNGDIGKTVTGQALAALVFCEVHDFTKDPESLRYAKLSIAALEMYQLRENGGTWGFGEDGKPDMLTTFWAAYAFKTAVSTGIKIGDQVCPGIMRYVDSVTEENGIVHPGNPKDERKIHLLDTACGGAIRVMVGNEWQSLKVQGAAAALLKYVAGNETMQPDGLYIRYAGTILTFSLGRDYWKKWNEWLKKERVGKQVMGSDFDGSYDPEGVWVRGRKPEGPDEHAGEKIVAVLKDVSNYPETIEFYETLASALAGCDSEELLEKILMENGNIPTDASALLCFRIGLLHIQKDNGDKAVDAFRRAYMYSGRIDKVLEFYISIQVRQGRRTEALKGLLADTDEGFDSEWRRMMAGTLLFDEKTNITDPVAFVGENMKGKHIDLKVVFAQFAKRRKKHDIQSEFFRQVYYESGRDETYFRAFVEAMESADQHTDALRILMDEAAQEARTSRFRIQKTRDLLFNEKCGIVNIPDAVGTKLKDRKKIRVLLYVECFNTAQEKKMSDTALELIKRVYYESGKRERHGREYVKLLIDMGRKTETEEILKQEAHDEHRLSGWRMDNLARLVMEQAEFTETPWKYAEAGFDDRPRAQVALKLAMAGYAYKKEKFPQAARLYSEVYNLGGRPKSLLQSYINALVKDEKLTAAGRELEQAIQTGYHTTWGFQTLGEIYRRSGAPETEVFRAVSCEVEIFPKDVQPRINLAQYYESRGLKKEALVQYREAVNIRPEDKYFYKVLIERAIRQDFFELAAQTMEAMMKRFPEDKGVMGAAEKELLEYLQTYAGDKTNEEVRKKIKHYLVKDLVVVMSWDTQSTDIDLHVTDPDKEECFYSHQKTKSGGALDHDDTDGLGPETFSIKRVKPGIYKVEVVYFRGTPLTKVKVQVFRNYSGDDETSETFSVELKDKKQRVTVTEVEVTE